MIKLSNGKFGILAGLAAGIISLGGVYLRDAHLETRGINEARRGNVGPSNLEIISLMQKETVLTYEMNSYRFEIDSLGTLYLVPYETKN